MISCKRVYDQASPNDGLRVLVDRLWPRGIKKTDLSYDIWDKDLAPTADLRKQFHSETIDFDEFSLRYREQLATKMDAVHALLEQTGTDNLTLLYAAKDCHHNHAQVLAEFLRQSDSR